MRALQKRGLKSKLVDHFEGEGYKVEATDSANIAIFTDRPVTKRSVEIGKYDCSYLTSFGEKEAENILNRK